MKGATEKATIGRRLFLARRDCISGRARRGLGMRRLRGRDSRESDIRRRLHGTNGVRVSYAESLPRPDELREILIARDGGQPYDQQEFARRVQCRYRVR